MGNGLCKNESSVALSSVYDLDEWVRVWMGRPKSRLEIDWSGVQFIPETTVYPNASQEPSESPKILFRTTYTNDLNIARSFEDEIEAKTHRYCQIKLSSAIKVDGGVNTTVTIPSQAVKHGFPPTMRVTNMCFEFHEELKQMIKTPVDVPKNDGVTVTVNSKEETFESNFTQRVRVRGNVVVREYDQSGRFIGRKESNVKEIASKVLVYPDKSMLDGIEFQSTHITLVIKGNCKFQYVVDKEVNVR